MIIDWLMTATRRIVGGSAAVRIMRPIVAGSLLCRAISVLIGAAGELRRHVTQTIGIDSVEAEQGRATLRLARVSAESWVVRVIWEAIAGVISAGRYARLRSAAAPLVQQSLDARVESAARIMMVALVAQTLVVTAGRIRIGMPGVVVRLLLAAASLLAIRYRAVLAAAWAAKQMDTGSEDRP